MISSECYALLDSKIRDTKMVMIVVMKEKQRGGKMRCGWGKFGKEKAQLRDKWSVLYAFQKHAKIVKEATMFDLDPRAERGTKDCRACKMNLICLGRYLVVLLWKYIFDCIQHD